MPTNIKLINNAPLTITSDNPVVDCGNDSTGAKVFTVDKPYDCHPGFSENPMRFKDHSVNINGRNFGGNGEDNEIELLEEPTRLKIIIR